jgi:YVTN family beta-propeller protein
MVVGRANDSIYVDISGSDSVARIDLAEGRVAAHIPVGRAPVGINASPSGECIYVGNRADGTVSVIGAADDVEWGRIPVGEAPAGIAVDPDTERLLVSNAGSATVSVIENLISGPMPRSPDPTAHPLVGRRLPSFELPDMRTGRLRHSREWAERKYILNFFASW